MAAAYWWGLPGLYVGPLSLKQRLRRCCRPKGKLSMESHSIAIYVNGTRIVADVEPRVLLVHFLREQAGLTGTHIGCDTSQCGACTVRLDGATVKSCTVLAVQADGHAVTTIEGFADPARLTPLQQAFHERHALQCGFCTPGMIFAAQALLDYVPDPTEVQVRQSCKAPCAAAPAIKISSTPCFWRQSANKSKICESWKPHEHHRKCHSRSIRTRQFRQPARFATRRRPHVDLPRPLHRRHPVARDDVCRLATFVLRSCTDPLHRRIACDRYGRCRRCIDGSRPGRKGRRYPAKLGGR